MKLQLHKTKKGYIAYNEHKIQPSDWMISFTDDESYGEIWKHDGSGYISPDDRKIIATDTSFTIKGVPQFQLPTTRKEEKSPTLESIIESHFNSYIEKVRISSASIDKQRDRDRYLGFIEGYKIALNTYSEDDLKSAIAFGGTKVAMKESLNSNEVGRFIECLKSVKSSKKVSKKLVAIDVEVDDEWLKEFTPFGGPYDYDSSYISPYKIVKSKQYPNGLLQVDEYLYE